VAPPTNGHVNGHAAYQPRPAANAAVPAAIAGDGSQPVLPPRPTGRLPAAPVRTSWIRSWPLVVIVLAVLAILTAVVLMVWPPSSATDGDMHGTVPPPAPERMDTNPLVPDQPHTVTPSTPPSPPATPARPDPWADPDQSSRTTPPQIDIPDDPDDDLDDPGGVVGGVVGGGGGGGSTGGTRVPLAGRYAVMMEISLHMCDRAKQCGQQNGALESYCDVIRRSMQSYDLQAPVCAARTRCLRHIDELSCSGTIDFSLQGLQDVKNQVQDCVDATTSC